MSATVELAKKLERVLGLGHPWIFRDALRGTLPPPGQVVTVLDGQGRFVARGLAEEGPIGVRVFLTADAPLNAALIAGRIEAAARLRERVVPPATDAYRLVHGEGDRLPGVVCDVYGAWAVLQLDGQAIAAWRDAVVDGLRTSLAARGVAHLLEKRGRREKKSVELVFGQAPQGPVEVREHGMRLRVDLLDGQKTGLFLDHRESRRLVRDLARGRRVLNLYGYTGGFSVAAGLGGAGEVMTVDRARSACALADENWRLNDLPPGGHESRAEPVQPFLEAAAKAGRSWDLIVSDPPSFAPSEQKLGEAKRAYQALHRAVLDRLAPGGLLLAASCSSHLRAEAFEQTLLAAARADGRVLQVLERRGAPADHPRLAAFPEGDYLKVVLVQLLA